MYVYDIYKRVSRFIYFYFLLFLSKAAILSGFPECSSSPKTHSLLCLFLQTVSAMKSQNSTQLCFYSSLRLRRIKPVHFLDATVVMKNQFIGHILHPYSLIYSV